MGGSFESSMSVPIRREEIFAEAGDMVSDLSVWKLIEKDAERRTLVCERKGGLLSGAARITITVDGPEGIPSATVTVKSESQGGLLSRDKANVTEFMTPFHRRVC